MNFKTLFPELTDGQLAQLRRLIAEEVIGADRAYIATDDLIKDTAVSWAIQMRFKAEQLTKLDKLIGGEKS